MTEPCPHCRRLREERDEALEALRQARAGGEDLGRLSRFMAAFKITPTVARLLAALFDSARPLNREALLDAMGSSGTSFRLADSQLWRLRRALLAVDGELVVETIARVGWRLTPLARARIARVAEGGT